MKECSRCQKTKDSSEFGKRVSSKDRLDSRCLECIKECSKQSADKNRAKNGGGIAVVSRLCPTCRTEKLADCFGTNLGSKDGLRSECKDCRNIKTRHRYETDPDFKEGESIRAAQNYIEDRDRILGRSKEWSKNNPEKKVGQRHRRVARLYGQIEFDLPIDFIKILKEEQENKCAYCSRDDVKLTVEHMLPLSRGGKHCMNNIVVACTTCNFSKHNKTLEEWLVHNQKLHSSGIISDVLITICDNLIKLIKNRVK